MGRGIPVSYKLVLYTPIFLRGLVGGSWGPPGRVGAYSTWFGTVREAGQIVKLKLPMPLPQHVVDHTAGAYRHIQLNLIDRLHAFLDITENRVMLKGRPVTKETYFESIKYSYG